MDGHSFENVIVQGQDLLIWVLGVQNVDPKQYGVVPESGVHVDLWMNNKYVVWRTYKVLGWTSK